MKKLYLLALAPLATSLAFAYQPGTYSASYPGINGKVPVTVTFDKTKITRIVVGQQKETPGIGQKAVELIPNRIIKAQSIGIEGVSGASMTSKAIFDGVLDCVKQAGGDIAAFKKPVTKKAVAITRRETLNTDLVIVGGGGAGMVAAINASDRGLKVVLVEKMNFLGGANSICSGFMVIQGSKLQKELGEKSDSPAKMAYDLLDNGENLNDLNALTFYANNVGASVDWARSKGIKFPNKMTFWAEHRTPRTVFMPGGCPAYAHQLRGLVEKSSAAVLLATKATEIMMKRGKAVGIKAVNDKGIVYTIRAKAVLLATGGFGNNKSMLQGELKNALYYGPVGSMGDGHMMAAKAGADLQLMALGKIYPNGIEVAPGIAKSTLAPNAGAYSEAGILVDLNGKRVVDEKGTGKAIKNIQVKQPNATLWLVLDAKSFAAFRKLCLVNGISEAELNTWLKNNGKCAPFFIHGKSLEEAAQIAGINVANLRATVERYNGFVQAGKDTDFNRPAQFMKKTIDTVGDFYIIEQKPRFATTLGGAVVTTNLEVKDTQGKVIPGLYAAGEMANSVHGNDSSPGANVGWALTSGKAVSDVIADRIGRKTKK